MSPQRQTRHPWDEPPVEGTPEDLPPGYVPAIPAWRRSDEYGWRPGRRDRRRRGRRGRRRLPSAIWLLLGLAIGAAGMWAVIYLQAKAAMETLPG